MFQTLNNTQRQYRAQFLGKVAAGTYMTEPHPCICGGGIDWKVALEDRYGLPLRTVLCMTCGLMRSDPYYDPHSLMQFYTYEYRALYSGNVQADEKFYSGEVATGYAIKDYVGPIKGRVFEMGCGAGGILKPFLDEGCEVYGSDYGSEYLAMGRKKGIPNLHEGGSAALASFAPADLIILNHTLEHLPDMRAELRALRNMLSDNGLLFIGVPGLFFLHKHGRYQGDIMNLLQNAHAWNFSLKTLQYVLSLEGFELVRGSERIYALFRKADVLPTHPHAGNARRIKRYLKAMRVLSPLFKMKASAYRMIRPLLV